MESIDEHLVRRLTEWNVDTATVPELRHQVSVGDDQLRALFDVQAEARHLDLALRWLQGKGEGFYTIGSSGHESNAAVAMALRPSDPALLHYRSGGFYAGRARQVPGSTSIRDVIASATCSIDDPISGGRHKVFGHPDLSIIPQTSTIASHLPRALGLAFALGRGTHDPAMWPDDSLVVASFGDASANHSTAVGSFNAAGYCSHRGLRLPLLLVCEDNGIGISTRTPAGWTARALAAYPGLDYLALDGADPQQLIARLPALLSSVRSGQPAILHLTTARFMGHAGSDAELGYRSRAEIEADYGKDPILATALALISRDAMSAKEVLNRYEEIRAEVMRSASLAIGTPPRLASAEDVMRPLATEDPNSGRADALRVAGNRTHVFGGKLPEEADPLTLSQALNAALRDVMAAHPRAMVFGEDVGRKGGVYGTTRGLQKTFGATRVFDSLLDEQSILGIALGSALAGAMPIPEIQYLAYVHNAIDQIRGEAASLPFFSADAYRNGMVIRIAGLAYQKGFGGHFHNDNAIAAFRDIPGLIVAVPAHPSTAPDLLRSCFGLAAAAGKVCVFLEPIALYHERHLGEGDAGWLAPYRAPEDFNPTRLGQVHIARPADDPEVVLVSFGNGLRMSLRAAARWAARGHRLRVIDLQWLVPLPLPHLYSAVSDASSVLVVDETREAGGVSEGVMTGLIEAGYSGRLRRVNSRNSYIPLGPAAEHVLLGEDHIEAALKALLASG